MTSNSQTTLKPIYHINQCTLQDDLPHQIPPIHSSNGSMSAHPCKNMINYCSTPSIQRSVQNQNKKIVFNTSLPKRNASDSARKLFFQNSTRQRSNIGIEKWKKNNGSVRNRSEEKKESKRFLFGNEEEISENWLQDISSTPNLYTVVSRPCTSVRKQSKNWFGKFVHNNHHQKTQNNDQISVNNHKISDSMGVEETEDSFQVIETQQPGPGYYDPNFIGRQYKNIKNTFGNTKRFIEKRPVTAQLGNTQPLSTLEKKPNRNLIENVCFGTNINNPRTEFTKIRYQEWYRSHCCKSTSDLVSNSLKKYHNTANSFKSAIKRFPDAVQKYNGPDYYCKVKVKTKKSDLPAHYFISDVRKGLPEPSKQNQNHKDKSNNPLNNRIMQNYTICAKKQIQKKNEWFPQRKIPCGQKQLSRQIGGDVPKNSLGDKKRSISPKKRCPLAKICENLEEDPIDLDHRTSKVEKTANVWMKKSFNVKFQAW